MKQLLLLTFLAIFSAQPALALIACSHIQVCNLIDSQLTGQDSVRTKQTYLPFTFSGDPHHFEPTSAQIRKLLTSEYLISGPLALHPWMGPVLEKRAQNPKLKTFSLEPDPKFSKIFPQASLEALSHFWLYPEISCQMQKQLALELQKWGRPSSSGKDCPSENVNFAQSKAFSALAGKTIVLTHDALSPILVKHGLDVITLRGSHHGERLSSATLKKLHNELAKKTKVIWLLEEPLENSDQILALIRKTDHKVSINTLGFSLENPFETYLRILKKLSKIDYGRQ